ncbi:NmrA family NAD(P)-binding protein [Marinomonas mediterranea]|jgi:Predicted nucleoside-diphosphate-sugar epimerases|uniref:Saccharopine dehydrogenase n=1 Tax=Marinomonas mediterranea (strain ATCC 700492 / JCM 21426 / NBRC 103028 / MMB-1) TaxID=717774 RepID=F2JUH8_MARM1|nr:SDR family oxidoreductase [Marinomonas mediterranea]ADZ89311.1 Saccharopine dehydrogenase [Marinomonas mediterranea MMB-1]WCN11511.1 NmrA family NAD(P)-binding protein [Marinomonas mediterranea]WCN15581.1 NmrA family NAD(P)-binding protein [Marinomonas mediterranea MMB-1]
MILVTGATGKLGKLVIESLVARGTPASDIVAGVRSPEKAADLADQGVVVRKADYSDPATLTTALEGVKRVVLVSSSEVGQRLPQHQNVINAAKEAGVELIAYTSLLNATESPMILAQEHVGTEKALTESGVPHVLLRNSWYNENYTENLGLALEHGAVLGSAKDGKFASATRADYAEAAAVAVSTEGHAGKTYELAGSTAYTLTEYAQYVSELSGKTVIYQDLPAEEYTKVLVGVGLPEGFAAVLADSDVGTSNGALYSDSKDLETLIGRPSTPIQDSIKAAL